MNLFHMSHNLPSVRDLWLVQELHRTGSATRAADRLGVTQPAISHQLRELEGRLGVELCIRAGKKLVLSAAGHRLLQAADAVLQELERASGDITRAARGEAGTLRISAQCHTSYQWLPPLLARFRAAHPSVQFDVAVQYTREPIAALLEGMLDIALVTNAVRDRRIRVRALASDEHVAIVAPGHPLASRRFITPAELAEQDLLLYSASVEDSFTVRHILRPAGVRPARVRFVQLTEAIVEMVKAGLGVSVMPMWSIRSAVVERKIAAVRITPSGIHRVWHAATLRQSKEPAFIHPFLDMVDEALRALSPPKTGRRKR
jgi:LysR family transcriptional regulator for metE and metH